MIHDEPVQRSIDGLDTREENEAVEPRGSLDVVEQGERREGTSDGIELGTRAEERGEREEYGAWERGWVAVEELDEGVDGDALLR